MERVKVQEKKKSFSKMSSVIYNIFILKGGAIFSDSHEFISMLHTDGFLWKSHLKSRFSHSNAMGIRSCNGCNFKPVYICLPV